MLCAFPQAVSPKTSRPCGQCINCRVNFKRKWLCRLLLESKTALSTQFLTLTYSPENQPLCKDPETGEPLGTIRKSDVQDYIRALRQRLSRTPWCSFTQNTAVRYYAVGEYGTKSARPHYHLLLFGLDERFHEIIASTWTAGFSSIRPADSASMAYTLKYAMKALNDPTNPWLRGRAPTFAIMSKRPPLGTLFLPKVADSIKRVAFDSSDNPICPLPTTVQIDGQRYPLDRTLQSSLSRMLNIDGDPKKLEDAYPTRFFITRTSHDQAQATGAHHKAHRNRHNTTNCPV